MFYREGEAEMRECREGGVTVGSLLHAAVVLTEPRSNTGVVDSLRLQIYRNLL